MALFAAPVLPSPLRGGNLPVRIAGYDKPGLGITPASWAFVLIELASLTSERRIRMESKTLCKVLHLVGFHGWRPERLQGPVPTASWNTEIIVPHITPYLSGSLSTSDAAGLAAGLRTMLASESSGLAPEIHYATLALQAISDRGPFEVIPQGESALVETANPPR